jgi:hypothetical protein
MIGSVFFNTFPEISKIMLKIINPVPAHLLSNRAGTVIAVIMYIILLSGAI